MNHLRHKMIIISVAFIFSSNSLAVLPGEITKNDEVFYKCKEHRVKYALLINVVDVGVYLNDCQSPRSLLSSANKLVRFHYHMNVKKEFFAEAAEKYFLKNLKTSSSVQEIEELLRFNNAYQDIQADEHYDLLHSQSGLLSLYKNNQFLIASDSKDFGFKYFTIWFGKHPAIKSLKKALT